MTAPRYAAAAEGDEVVLSDREAGASARIDVRRGANVVAFRTRVGTSDVDVLAPRGIPILFPFPNRVPHGRFTWRGREHQLDVNERGRPNHNHGLVRDRPWTIVDVEASAAGAALRASIDLADFPDALRQFPFRCVVDLTVALVDGRLRHDVSIANVGELAMPMGYGIHPWFPAALRATRDMTEVRMPAARRWELAELIPTGRTEAVSDRYDFRDWRSLAGHAYDDVFTAVVRRADEWSVAGVRYPEGIELVLEAGPAYREWVLFADPTRDAIAVEPYSCATNAVNLEPSGVDAGLVALEPGRTWSAPFSLSVRSV